MSSALNNDDDQNGLHPLSEEELSELGLEKHEIWYLMVNEMPCGPYSLEGLKKFLADHKDFDQQTQATNAEGEKWAPLFKYPFFDRRSLGNTQSPLDLQKEDTPLMLLVDGRPQGPYKHKEIYTKLEEKEILPTHLVSADRGRSWFAIHRHPRFDRRNRPDHGELPDMPDQHMLEKMSENPIHHCSNPHLTAQNDQKSSLKEFLQLLTLASGENPSMQQSKAPQQLEQAIESGQKISPAPILAMGTSIIALSLLIILTTSPGKKETSPSPERTSVGPGPQVPRAPSPPPGPVAQRERASASTKTSPPPSGPQRTQRAEEIDPAPPLKDDEDPLADGEEEGRATIIEDGGSRPQGSEGQKTSESNLRRGPGSQKREGPWEEKNEFSPIEGEEFETEEEIL